MKVRLLTCLLFVFLLNAGTRLSSQQYNIKQYNTKNGLANSNVNYIFLDSRGYLWFATQGGISRFDGRSFRNFTSRDGLPGNNVNSICEDHNGNIWFSCFGSGVAMYNGYKFTVLGRKEGLKNLDINAVFCDSGNRIWMASYGGLMEYDGKHVAFYDKELGLPGNEFFSIAEDSLHTMWFGSKHKGLVRYDRKTFRTYTKKDGLSDDNIYSLRCDQKGTLWIGTVAGGVCKIKNNTISQVNIPVINKSLVYCIHEDQRNNMWFATERGLIKLDGLGKYSLFTQKNGLSTDDLYALGEDYEGNIWVGSGLGACLFKNEAFVTYTEKEGLLNSKVNALEENASGEFLVGTDGAGIQLLDAKGMSPLKIKELENTKVTNIFVDSKQRAWVGLNSDDKNPLLVLSRKKGQYKVEKKCNSLAGVKISTVSKVLEDKSGNIWVATFGAGAFKMAGDVVTQYKDSSNVCSLNILTLFRDSKDNIWFGTFDKGLVKYNGSTFVNYTKKDGLGDNWIWSIAEDKSGNMYFGTNENGLSRFDGKKFINISTRQGLVSDLVYAITIDKQNKTWVGTDKGINRLETDKDFNLISSKYYGEQDGLRGTEIAENGFFYDHSGTMWICTTNGLTQYNAKFDYVNSTPPRVILSGIRLYYQDIDWTKYGGIDAVSKLPLNLSLSHKDNHLTFDYQALTTNNVRYQFKLEGLDATWSPLTTNTQAVYTNIPPGENYTFSVKAINSDGFWSTEVASFRFSITPPFWKTWWFLTISVLLVLGAVVTFIRWRTAKLETEKKVLEERVVERTVELKGANDQLSVAFKDIKDSINYARRIQQAILPLDNDIRKELPEHFILFKPRDVVSGDFYWFNKKNDKVYIAACDCTGHGVPGAFMSIIGNSLLNEIAHEADASEPGTILNNLRDKIILALKQRSGEQESKDGMDMMLCCIDRKTNTLTFAGANNPLYLIRNGELKEFKGNKQPIGVYGDVLKPFTNQEIALLPGDQIYLFSDGYPDQFGGPRGKKFLYTRFKELLVSISARDMNQQAADLERAFWDWKNNQEQVDDVLVIGIRI
jgi:ligand-binding sensor domain-containing protein/serine phosphatase RsbU (regulator of sigma subunit)